MCWHASAGQSRGGRLNCAETLLVVSLRQDDSTHDEQCNKECRSISKNFHFHTSLPVASRTYDGQLGINHSNLAKTRRPCWTQRASRQAQHCLLRFTHGPLLLTLSSSRFLPTCSEVCARLRTVYVMWLDDRRVAK